MTDFNYEFILQNIKITPEMLIKQEWIEKRVSAINPYSSHNYSMTEQIRTHLLNCDKRVYGKLDAKSKFIYEDDTYFCPFLGHEGKKHQLKNGKNIKISDIHRSHVGVTRKQIVDIAKHIYNKNVNNYIDDYKEKNKNFQPMDILEEQNHFLVLICMDLHKHVHVIYCCKDCNKKVENIKIPTETYDKLYTDNQLVFEKTKKKKRKSQVYERKEPIITSLFQNESIKRIK